MKLPKFLTNPNPDIYMGDNYLVLDTETTNKDIGTALNKENRLLLSVYGKEASGYEILWGSEYETADLIERIYSVDFIVAHNAKYDLQWLKRCGLDLARVIVFDTMIAEYVLDGNQRKPYNLDFISKLYGFGGKAPFIDICMHNGVCPSEMPESLLESRCVKDVSQTEAIFLAQREKLKELELLPVMYLRSLLTPVLADIEFNGMCLDSERVEETWREHYHRLQKLEAEMNEFTGGINFRSSKQVAEFLYDELRFPEPKNWKGEPVRTAGDKRKADAKTIENLKPKTERQRRFVELKQELGTLTAALSKNLDFFYGVCKEHGGIFQAQFNQTVTKTHRLSSSGRKVFFSLFDSYKSVQFQNLPRIFKKLFKARKEGWKIGEIDGAQLEFRVAAFIGNDTRAYLDIVEGVDVHSFTSNVLTEAGQPTDRQGAKSHTFKPLYGGQSGTKAEQEYYKAFREKYPDIARTQQGWIDEVLRTKKLRLPWGLIFYWPDTKITKSGYVVNTSNICNYPVQSFATADIIPIAVIFLWHRMRLAKMQSFIVNTIHDSVISEIHPDEAELYEEIGVQSFTTDVYDFLKKLYDITFTVPLGAGVKIGGHWSEAEEKKYESEPPKRMAA